MRKSRTFKTKVLALVLTVMMIVGALPMAVFAITPVDNSTPTSDYRVDTSIDGVVSNLWNSNPKYWTLAMSSSAISMKPSYSTNANGGRAWSGGTASGDVVTLPAAEGARYMLGHTRSPSFNDPEYALIFSQNTAGIDFAFSFDLAIDASMEEVATEGVFMFGPAFVATEGVRYDTLRVKVSGDIGARKYELYWPAGYAEDFATKLGNKICDLEVGKAYNIKALYDISHKDDQSNVYFVWIDGEFVGCNNPNNGASVSYGTNIYSGANRQAGYNTAAGTNYANGPMIFGFDFYSQKALAWTASNFDLYLYDDTPDDGDVRNSTRSKQFVYYNDFNTQTVGAELSGSGLRKNYAGNVGQGYTDKGGNKAYIVEDAAGDNALKMNAKGESWYDVSIGNAGSTFVSHSGKSFVLSFDIKADGFGNSGPLLNFGDRGRGMGNGKYETCIVPIMRDLDGSLYIAYKDGAAMYSHAVNGDDGKLKESWNNYGGYSSKALSAENKAGGFLTKLTGDKYTNIAIFVNVQENYFTVFVDGVDKTGKLTLVNEETKQKILDAGFTNGYAVTESRVLYNHTVKDVYLDNVTSYFANTVAFNTIDAEIETDYITPTPAKLNALYAGDASYSMRWYNDFNAATLGATNATVPAATAASGVGASICAQITWVDDGNGGLAAKWRATARNTYLNIQDNASGDRRGDKASGKSFVFSLDIKGGNVYAETPLVVFSAHSFFKEAVQTATNANYCPVYIGSDGLYLGYDGSAMINTSTKFAISAAGVKKAENKILTLSKDEFVNIAVAVNVPNNTWSLYVDGVAYVTDLTFINPEHLGENNSNVRTDYYANGYGLCYARIHQNESAVYTTNDGMTVDNVAIYQTNTFKATAEECNASQLTDGVSGYKYENDGIYYYENNKIVANKVTPDGILTIDENGKLFYGETAVTGIADYYISVNGDIVPVNGIYNGYYTASIILGKSCGNLYYYDEDGNRVANNPCYAVNGIPYAFDANGVRALYSGIYNGKLYENSATVNGLVGDKLYVDGVVANGDINGKFYADGVLATGIFGNKLYTNGDLHKDGIVEYEGDKYVAGADGSFIEGTYKIADVYYVFSASNGYKGVVAESGEVADGATDSNGKVYENVQDAIAGAIEGDTVVVSQNISTEGTISVNNNVTLNLNGATITAAALMVYNGSEIIDSGATKGLIKVGTTDGKRNIVVPLKTTSSILVYNSSADRDGYEVASVTKQDKFEATENNDGFVLVLRPSLDNNTAYNKTIFSDGDSGITFELHIRDAEGNNIRTFYFKDSVIREVYSGKNAVKVTVRGASNYAGQELTVVYVLKSDTQMLCEMVAGTINPQAAE